MDHITLCNVFLSAFLDTTVFALLLDLFNWISSDIYAEVYIVRKFPLLDKMVDFSFTFQDFCNADMEWNTKWDWENLDLFSSKAVAISSPKKLQSTTDWGINEKEDIYGPFNLSGVVNVENISSEKSSLSASTESLFKDCMKVSNFSFEGSRSFHEVNGTSPSLETSICCSDQSIGLKLGKRTYFENSNTKTSSSQNVHVSSISTEKKVKLSHQNISIQRCQVEGCNIELLSAKEYHRKHRVCDNHSKSLKVVVGGLERRFCQQCSRFHGLPEFDGKKRSCRRRLFDHNARRRKPQQETILFNSRSTSSSFYDGQQQMSFVFNDVPLVQTKPAMSCVWETPYNSHHYATLKAEKYEDHDGLTPSLAFQFPNSVCMPTLAFNRIMPSKGTTASVFDQGSNADAFDIRHALSLLSNNSWGSHESDFSVLDHPMQINSPTITQHGFHSAQHNLPLPSPECWQFDQQSIDPHIHATTNFQEYRIPKLPYEIHYANAMDEILKPL